METIYDVFRMLVNASRHSVADTKIAEAHAIIDAADPAVTTPQEAKPDA